MVPSVEACFRLMDRYGMLEHIRAHSLVVAKVAHFLARKLIAVGVEVSIETVTAGALMHDIGKTDSLQSGRDHSRTGARICIENNLHEIADIVREHVRLKDYNPNDRLSEKEIVFYSDKRVNHDRIVNLDDRLAYILERYGKEDRVLRGAIQANFDLCRKVEARLFHKLDFSADRLAVLAGDEDIGVHRDTRG
ncbi:MAG: metal-dependent phosphohydrolase [Deltaproteobacteria bacterium]|nr:MAG: metal-dependent phosphohydrolase [Deltaproteobacteria bacterium]